MGAKLKRTITKQSRNTQALATKPRHHVIDPIDRCTMGVRSLVLEWMDEMQPEKWPDLFVALRDEVDDLDKAAEYLPNRHLKMIAQQSLLLSKQDRV